MQQQPIEINGTYWTSEALARAKGVTQRHIGLLIRTGQLDVLRLSQRVQLIEDASVQRYFPKQGKRHERK